MQQAKEIRLNNKKATQKVAFDLAQAYSSQKQIIFLKGELGAGKTTFCQFLLQGLGYLGRVKSPTYSLIESYSVAEKTIYHLDFYRLHQANDLYSMGLLDYFDEEALFLIEWPDILSEIGIKPDLTLEFSLIQKGARLERRLKIMKHPE